MADLQLDTNTGKKKHRQVLRLVRFADSGQGDKFLIGVSPWFPTHDYVMDGAPADLHLRAMTNPAARGERFLAVTGDFLWIVEIARIL